MTTPFPSGPGSAAPGAASPGDPGGAAIMSAAVVNQWAAATTQPASFGPAPPAYASTVIALNSSTNVGVGSGTPTAGNWLVAIGGWNQAGLTPVTLGWQDDTYEYWRPGNETTSTWAVSPSPANTRCNVWYCANLIRAPGDVYAGPTGAMAGLACLVIEIAGLGPWDVITGIDVAYAAAATSLNLALAAPSAASAVLAVACGDTSAVTQSLAPGGSWTALHTVTATDGSDHTCDAVLTSAFLASTTGSVSVNATATGATDLSGVIIAFEINAPSPLTATGISPGWPGRMILEAGFGSGFGAAEDGITWTSLSDSASPIGTVKRFWSWQDSGGIPYGLGQLQSGTGTVQLDNFDGWLSPSNSTTSPYYPNVTTGVPVRLRAAIGTIGGVTVNRWYCIERNALKWPEKRNKAFRDFVALSLTDSFSVVSAPCPTPYRGEILRVPSLYAWWPMDDSLGAGGVQPTTLLNAAAGNTNALAINASPSGIGSGDAYTAYPAAGTDATSTWLPGGSNTPSVATASVQQLQGWMYGDPASSQSAYAASGPVTAQPGSAAWQQTGMQGTGGSNGWYLSVNDANFPVLTSGVTVKGWFNAALFGTSGGWFDQPAGTYSAIAGQPYSAITLCTLSTGSLPVAELQLTTAGALNFITYHGSTATTTTIYSTSDLRCASFVAVDVVMTATTWTVYLNGGITAQVSGTATGMTSAWTWLTINGDWGSGGPASGGTYQHGGNVAYSHWSVFSAQLPAWQLRAQYLAAITGFGLLPAPQTVALASVQNEKGTGWTADGQLHDGSYGVSGSTDLPFTFAALAVAQAGSYYSGPSARAVTAGIGSNATGTYWGSAIGVSFTALAPQVTIYTAASADAETSAAIVCGSFDGFSSGFGGSAVDSGVCVIGNGTGAAPPSAPSALGDTAGWRVERLLYYGGACAGRRAVDQDALACQAALDIGGQQAGQNVSSIVGSTDAWMFVTNGNALAYRQRSHLATDTTVWYLGMNVAGGQIPGGDEPGEIDFSTDPQRVVNDIRATPYSPDGATLPLISPTNAAAVTASQDQYGDRPQAYTSYLQSQTEIQNQVNWRFAQYGTAQRRLAKFVVKAHGHPAGWPFVLGAQVGDLAQVYDDPMKAPATTQVFRIASISRSISCGANGSTLEGSATITGEYVPTNYWS